MKIGQKLKEERSKKKLTQEELAEILNVSRSTVSSWEVGRTYPDLDLIVALIDLYEVSLDILLREDAKVVEKITKESKSGRKRKWLIGSLLFISILLTLFLGYQIWLSNQFVSPGQIEDARLLLNGNELNTSSEIVIELDFGNFYTYGGYWMDTNEDKDTIRLELYREMSLLDEENERTKTLTIPLDFLDSFDEIEKVVIQGFADIPAKTLYERE